jgi:hypothetical protein
MATKELTNNIVSYSHLYFLTSWVWRKLWKIRHWNWEGAFCFVLLHLASGENFITSLVNTYLLGPVNQALSQVTTLHNFGQQTLPSTTQQFISALNNATQTLATIIQTTTNTIQQVASSVNKTSAQVESCAAFLTPALSALYNTTCKLKTNVCV